MKKKEESRVFACTASGWWCPLVIQRRLRTALWGGEGITLCVSDVSVMPFRPPSGNVEEPVGYAGRPLREAVRARVEPAGHHRACLRGRASEPGDPACAGDPQSLACQLGRQWVRGDYWFCLGELRKHYRSDFRIGPGRLLGS